ncbi:glycosyltransferase family 2 protein [Flavobacterium subsaxonicum]|uniref:Glycosyl transferase family 2 n=1 Tax=Flavobacterium subsaxonicum WB 4.1-42 = DSM 21790 TaxID=1121898 RepID=A0A0A2MXN6_9FLAO|nr:glycosyltransferase family 2 protein [Flavobacterium subsaxonicum]KGO92990.1 glycosyl transferase family 2 [Flavobacterium subsaxonicum WB 4.1-42 = DSM 21790]
MFDIAVILIHYNSGTLTQNCIQSIVSSTSATCNYQIIVIDNNSEYADYVQLKNWCDAQSLPNLQLVRSRINTGFGGGNMLGVQYANARYLAVVNNDTVLKTDCLTILKSALEQDSTMGLVGGQSFKGNDAFLTSMDHFASPAREILGRKFLETINSKRYPKRKKLYDQPVKVDFVSGSFMLIRSADFNAIGGFDTNIFLYYEETDLCKRLKAYGKNAYLIPAAQFIHYHGASTQKSIAIKKELKISLLYVLRKHYGIFGRLSVLSFMLVKYFFSSIVKPKNWSLFFLLLKGAPISSSLKTKQLLSEK